MTERQVIDGDSHVQEPMTWLAEVSPDLAGRIPFGLLADGLALFVLGRTADGGRRTGEAERFWAAMDGLRALPMGEAARRLEGSRQGWAFTTRSTFDLADRLSYLDRSGIGKQVVNPNLTLNLAAAVASQMPECYGALLDAYNDWIIEKTAGSGGRLLPTVLLDFTRPATLADQLAALAGRGARTFLVPSTQVEGRLVGHVDHDRLWAVAEERQMVGIVHLGYDTVDGGRSMPSMGPVSTANAGAVNWSQHVSRLQLGMASLVGGGAFTRHPDLRIVIEEFGSSWIVPWMEQLDLAVTVGVVRRLAGEWPDDLLPSELVRRHFRVLPLPRDDIERVAGHLGPGVLAFGSDYPHSEGWAGGVDAIRDHLTAAPSLDADRFFSGNLSELAL